MYRNVCAIVSVLLMLALSSCMVMVYDETPSQMTVQFHKKENLPGVGEPQSPSPVPLPASTIPFPSSTAEPKGTPWRTIHDSGFTGSADDACRLMKLGIRECATLRDVSSCAQVEIPDGVVLDYLTFTRGGVHRAQKDVRVALRTYKSRNAYLCNLGHGRYAGRVWQCGNYFMVSIQPLA